MNRGIICIIFTLIVSLFSLLEVKAATWYVNSASTGTPDGLTWATARTTLAAGIADAVTTNDIVLVAPGNGYTATGTITPPAGNIIVKIYGLLSAAGTDTITGAKAWTSGTPGASLNAPRITQNGGAGAAIFTLNGDGQQIKGFRFICDTIATNPTGGINMVEFDNLIIMHNTFKMDASDKGVYSVSPSPATAITSATIEWNDFNGPDAGTADAVSLSGGAWTATAFNFRYNHITQCRSTFDLTDADTGGEEDFVNISFSYNIIDSMKTNAIILLKTGATGTATITNFQVIGNRFNKQNINTAKALEVVGSLAAADFAAGSIVANLLFNSNAVLLSHLETDAVSNLASDANGTDVKVIDATLNWWGNSAGPKHSSNPIILARDSTAEISNGVKYIPWWYADHLGSDMEVNSGPISMGVHNGTHTAGSSLSDATTVLTNVNSFLSATITHPVYLQKGTYTPAVELGMGTKYYLRSVSGQKSDLTTTGGGSGGGADSTIIDAQTVCQGTDTRAIFKPTAASNYVKILGIKFINSLAQTANINNFIDAVAMAATDTLDISNCVFYNSTDRAVTIPAGGASGYVSISRSTFYSNKGEAIYNGALDMATTSMIVLFTNDTIYNNQTYTSAVASNGAIDIIVTGTNVSNLKIQNCKITSNIKWGIVITPGATEWSSLGNSPVISNCQFGSNLSGGVNRVITGGTISLDARYNYWGSASGPNFAGGGYNGTGDVISDLVSATPYYTDITMQTLLGIVATRLFISPTTNNLRAPVGVDTARAPNNVTFDPDTAIKDATVYPVTAGNTIYFLVWLADNDGTITNAAPADINVMTLTNKRGGTYLRDSTTATFTVGANQITYKVGRFKYTTIGAVDKDSVRVTTSATGVTATNWVTFTTVPGKPVRAKLMTPNLQEGNNVTSVAADTLPVGKSIHVNGLLFDANGNLADTVGLEVNWSLLAGSVRDGFNGATDWKNSTPLDTTYKKGRQTPGQAGAAVDFANVRRFDNTAGVVYPRGTIGSQLVINDSTTIGNIVYADSLTGLIKVVATVTKFRNAVVTDAALDTIILMKQPGIIDSMRSYVNNAATMSSSPSKSFLNFSSGQNGYVQLQFKDSYGNKVQPDTGNSGTVAGSTGNKTIIFPKTNEGVQGTGSSTYWFYTTTGYQADNVFGSGAAERHPNIRTASVTSPITITTKRPIDTILTFARTPGTGLSAWPPDTLVYQSGTIAAGTINGYVSIPFITNPLKQGNDSIFIEAAAALFSSSNIRKDTLYIKSTLPLKLYAFKIAMKQGAEPSSDTLMTYGEKKNTAGLPMYIKVTPVDTNGNIIYAYKFRYLKVTLNGFTDSDTGSVPPTKFRKGVHFSSLSTGVLIDTANASALGDSSKYFNQSSGAYEVFKVVASKADSNLTVQIKSVAKDLAQTDTITRVWNVGTAPSIKINATGLDTLVLTPSAATYANGMPFDLNIALKDSFMNAIDTAFIVQVRANYSGVDGIQNPVLVKGNKSIRLTTDRTMSDLQFFASVQGDLTGGSRTKSNGAYIVGSYLNANLNIGAASIAAPAVLKGQDFPNDRGGWILLTWPPSANHPNNPSGTVDDNLPMDYYAIYRSMTSSIAKAVQWEIVPAVPLPTGLDSVRAAVSMHGDTSRYAYYWVAAVKGALPPGIASTGTQLPKDAGITLPENVVMGIPVTKEMQMSAAGVSDIMAVAGTEGTIISAVTNNVKVRSLDNTLPVGVFRPGATSIQLEDVLVVASVFGDVRNYDPIYDLVKDGVIDIEDILYQIMRLGSTGKEGKDGALINDGVNLDAALAINSASEKSGSMFTMAVNIDKVKEVAGYRFTVIYDPKNYEFVEAVDGAFLGSKQGTPLFVKNDEVKGEITVVGLLTGSDVEKAPDGNGILANMKFDWISEVMSEITVERIQLIDRNGLVNELKPVKLERPIALPTEYALEQNYPNPFNPETTIKFSLPEAAKVTLTIYNILGQKVKTLVNEDMKAGFKAMIWNGNNDLGVKVASGVYIYQVKAGKFVAQKKMVFLK